MMVQYINESFYPDGQCIEMTVAYSASVVKQTQQLACLLQDIEGVKAAEPKLRAMTEWCIGISKPTGRMPSFGDLHAADLRRSIYEPFLEWIDVPEARTVAFGADGPPPAHTVYPGPGQPSWGGYYAMRSSWTEDARYLCIDAGPWGTSHMHGDKLSFVASAHGADFIVDPVSTKYRNNEPDSFISTQPASFLHNTVTVDGVDEFMHGPREAKAPLTNTWQHGPHHTLFEGNYSFKPVKPVTWRRRVVFVDKAYWLLQDVLVGQQDSAAIEQNFQFSEDTKIEFVEGHVTVATAPNGAKLLLVPLASDMRPVVSIGDESERMTYWPRGKPRLNQGVRGGKAKAPHARGWIGHGKKLLPAPAVTYVGNVKLPAMLTLAIVPIAPGVAAAAPEITSRIDGGKTVWNLPMDGGTLTVTTSLDACEIGSPG